MTIHVPILTGDEINHLIRIPYNQLPRQWTPTPTAGHFLPFACAVVG